MSIEKIIKQIVNDKYVELEQHDENLYCIVSTCEWRFKNAVAELEKQLDGVVSFYEDDTLVDDTSVNVRFFEVL